MSLIVEDGSIVPNANSYVALVDADNYFTARNNHVWLSLKQDAKEALLIAATDYIELRFGRRFLGKKKQDNQPLSFPRTGIPYIAPIPEVLKKACFEYAIRANNGPLVPDPKFDESGMALTVRRKKVGPLETEMRTPSKGVGSTVTLFRPYPGADYLLTDLLGSSCENRWIRN